MSYKFTVTQQTNRFSDGKFALHPTEYTIACWIRPADANPKCIVVRSAGNPQSAWSHELRHSSVFIHYTYDGSSKSVTSSTNIVLNQLYHVAVTAKNGSQMKLYINGISEGTPLTLGTLWASGNDFWVSARDGNSYEPCVGELSEVCIWYKELTATEILKLATGKVRYLPQTIQPEFLHLYLPMNGVAENSAQLNNWKDLNTTNILTQTRTNDVTGMGDGISYP